MKSEKRRTKLLFNNRLNYRWAQIKNLKLQSPQSIGSVKLRLCWYGLDPFVPLNERIEGKLLYQDDNVHIHRA